MSQAQNFELISFNICPYVQRSVITLLYKGQSFTRKNIDLANKPDWFLEISPLGKVPVLNLGNDKVLFESAVINEYLDEVTEGSLLPEEPFKKAKARAYIELSSTLLIDQYAIMMAADKTTFSEKSGQMISRLVHMEKALSGGDFFNGKAFSLVDAALAPVLIRLEYIKEVSGQDLLAGYPKLQELSKSLMSKDYVINSAENLSTNISQFFKEKGTYLGSLAPA